MSCLRPSCRLSCLRPSSRRRVTDTAIPLLACEEARDWAALPRDIVVDIFLRLGPREVMLGAEFVCKPWRSVALEEPSLWRHIGTVFAWCEHWRDRDVEMAMKLVAVDRAAGQCESFLGDSNDQYLLNLVERAPFLKDLCIGEHYSDCESGEALVEALMKLHLLEEFEVYFNYDIEDRDESMLQSICQACPHLKKLVLRFEPIFGRQRNKYEYLKEIIDGEIPVMPKLHTLELCACDLRVEGLNAILDSCPVLENLYINGFFDKDEMNEELRMKCSRVKNLTLNTRISAATNTQEVEYNCFDTDSPEEY